MAEPSLPPTQVVIPAHAGIHRLPSALDPGVRRDDSLFPQP
jgi:hypothetical protein